MSAKATSYVWENSPYGGIAKLVHLALADIANDDHKNKLWVAQTRVAIKCGIDRKTVNRHFNQMIEDGFLELSKVGAQHEPNVYLFLMPDPGVPQWDTCKDSDVPESPSGVPQCPSGVPQSPTNSIELKRTQEETLAHFAQFWLRYPKKVDKPKALIRYQIATKKVSAAEILAGLDKWVEVWKNDGTERKFIPHPTTWLNGERWADSPEASNTALKGNAQTGKEFYQFEYEDGKDLVEKLGGRVFDGSEEEIVIDDF